MILTRHTVAAVLTMALGAVAARAAEPRWANEWSYAPVGRVHIVRGLWTREYRIEESLARLASPITVTQSWQWDSSAGAGWPGPGRQGGGGVAFLDSSPENLMRHQVIVISNANAKALEPHARNLVDYVRHGGGLVLLGGRSAFGAQYAKSPLGEICPVEFPGEGRWQSDLKHVPEGVEVKPGDAALEKAWTDLLSPKPPRVYWYHIVKPKPGAKIALSAGGDPLLVLGDKDAGRVAVFAGSVMGEPAVGQTAFWASDAWPVILSQTVAWASEPSRKASHGLSDDVRKAIPAAADGPSAAADDLEESAKPRKKDAPASSPLSPTWDLAAARCFDADSTRFLLAAAARVPGDLSPHAAALVCRRMSAMKDPKLAEGAEKLIHSGQPYKTAVGLVALARSPDASVALIQGFCQDATIVSKEGTRAAGTGALATPEEQRNAIHAAVFLRTQAILALGQIGPGSADPLRKISAALEPQGRLSPAAYVEVLEDKHRLYQAALVARLLASDPDAAGPLIDALMENTYVVARGLLEGNKPKDRLERAQAAVPAELEWQDLLYDYLPLVADSVLPATAKRIAADKDWRIIYIALPLLGGRRLSSEVKASLQASSLPAVRALAD